MKAFILTGFICLSSVYLPAQGNKTLPVSEVIIGRDFRLNADIKANRTDFPENIYRWSINDSCNMLLVQLRGMNDGTEMNDSGSILKYNLRNRQIHWIRKVDYYQTNIDHYDDVIIKSTGKLTHCLNYNTGDKLWSAKNDICYTNKTQGRAVGFRFAKNEGLTNDFEGFQLKTGELLWRRNISRDYDVNGIYELNDSTILVSANGLHAIHLKTGTGWDYEAHTGMKDYSTTVASNIFNIVFSLITKSDLEITSGHDLITGIVSNTLMDSTGIYMADKRSIVRIDDKGKVLWKRNLPREKMTRSTLFFKDSLICMVNEGVASVNYEPVILGKPFIAAFNKKTGKQVFLTTVGYKNDLILSYKIQRDTMFLLSKDRVFKYSLADGTELWENRMKTDSLGEFIQFGDTDMFARTDSVLIYPLLSDSTYTFVFTDKNQLLVLNQQLEIADIIPNDRICYCYLQKNGCKFIDTGENTLVTDKNNKPLAVLDISENATLIGTKLYDVQGNSFVEIDIDKLVGN